MASATGADITHDVGHYQVPGDRPYHLIGKPRPQTRSWHTVAIITAAGRHITTETYPATANGYQQISCFLAGHSVTAVGVEGTNSHGAGITSYLLERDVTVVEVLRPARAVRHRDGKSDPVDARAAARQVLTGEALSIPKGTP